MFHQEIKRVMPALDSQAKGRVRQADINIDSFPDMFVTIEFKSGQRKSYLLLSVQCTKETCPSKAVDHMAYGNSFPRRYFAKNSNENNVEAATITDMAGAEATMLVPFDADEDGRMDILVQKCDRVADNGEQRGCTVGLMYNNEIFDSFFIKAMMLAQTHRDFEDLEKHNFGSTISGTTFRYIVTALNDRKYVRVAAQAAQSSYQALELPYTFNGVGRSNNYLESFNVAYTTFDKGNQVRVFTPIIPNS